MSHIFPRQLNRSIACMARGEGVYLFDTDGKRYLDGSSGPATSCLGHSDASVIDAIKHQLDAGAYAHTGFFTSAAAEDLATALIDHAPGSLDRVYLLSGGSEAIEASLKLARQYFVECGQASRRHVIARRQSYHGNTLGALATGGNAIRRKVYDPLLITTSHIAPCYAYRHQGADETTDEYGLRVANELEEEIIRLGAENVMAFVAEPVVGATLGAVTAVEGYFKRIRAICDQYGVLLILDEVMCGMGRTGSLFACDQEGIAPDIMTIAKGLGAGYQPIGAMLCTKEIYAAIEQGTGSFQHGHTYMGHPTVCAGALAVIKRLTVDGLVAQVHPLGDMLRSALQETFGDHPHVGDIRGRGLFQALEFVENRETAEPFPTEKGISKRLKAAALDAGLICYPGSGSADGSRGDHVLLAPPFIITEEQIGELTDKLELAIQAVI